MQKLPFSFNSNVQPLMNLVTVMKQQQTFQDGFHMGREAGKDDLYEATAPRTEQEVWDFVQDELSPQAIQRDARFDERIGSKGTPLEQRVGFVVGYLLETFTISDTTLS